MNINEVLKGNEYDFLRNQERLGKRIDFLVFGGSIAYGLNGPNSDIDIRGICSPLPRDILGFPYYAHPNDLENKDVYLNQGEFTQYIDSETDTTIYNVNKYLNLIYGCNPNTIEMLGCLPEHYTHVSEVGQLLLDSKDLFLTKKAYNTFAGYARQQFYRLQNSLSRKSTQLDLLLQTVSVISRTYDHLEACFPTFKREMIDFYVVDTRDNRINTTATNAFFNSVEVDEETLKSNLTKADLENAQLRVNIHMDGISPKDFSGAMGEIYNIINNFSSHTGHRNNKKDEAHEDKHASHLRRLQKSCKTILKDHEIRTYCGDDIEELLDIKRGCYRNNDGTYKKEFFDIVNKEMAELTELYKTCTLPENPDIIKVYELAEKINTAALDR